MELTLWASCYRPPLWISPPVHVFSNVSSLNLSDSGIAHPALPHWVSSRVRGEALTVFSTVIPRDLEPWTVCARQCSLARNSRGPLLLSQPSCLGEQVPPSPAGRDSRQASDKPWIRMTFPTPLITARVPPSVFLQSQWSQLVTRRLWDEAWSCESRRTRWPSLSGVVRHWSP